MHHLIVVSQSMCTTNLLLVDFERVAICHIKLWQNSSASPLREKGEQGKGKWEKAKEVDRVKQLKGEGLLSRGYL